MRLVPLTGLLVVAMLCSDPASAASTNVALASAGGVATASTNTSTQALVNDGNAAAQGWGVPTSAATIKVDWGSGKAVNQVAAIFANANSKTFKFQYWNGSGWVDLSPTFSSNIETTVTYTPGSAVSTIAVRLNFSSAAASVSVNELQAFHEESDNTTSTNVALASAGGVATASTNTSTQALVNDGNAAAQGWGVPTSAATIKVDWGSGKAVNQVAAIFANANSKTFKFQYWNGSGWVDLSPTFSSNIETTVTYTPGSAVSTIAVRLNFSSAAPSVSVNELQAFHEESDNTTSSNVALASAGGVATASTNTSTQALVNDGNAAAQGWGVPTSAATIKVDWGSGKAVNQVAAIFANANSKTFKFQYWNGSGWVDLSPTFSSNIETTVTYTPGSAVSTIAVRLNFSSAAPSVSVNELQAFHEESDNTTSSNVALASAGGVATASTNTSTQALVNDGNAAAQGWGVPTSAATIKVDWGSGKAVNQVAAIFANANSKTFKFQYWNGSGWVDLSPTFSTNTETTVTYTPGSAVSTISVRLNFSSAAASVSVNELQAFHEESDNTTST